MIFILGSSKRIKREKKSLCTIIRKSIDNVLKLKNQENSLHIFKNMEINASKVEKCKAIAPRIGSWKMKDTGK